MRISLYRLKCNPDNLPTIEAMIMDQWFETTDDALSGLESSPLIEKPDALYVGCIDGYRTIIIHGGKIITASQN